MGAMNDFMLGGVPPAGGGMDLMSAYTAKPAPKHSGSRMGNFSLGKSAGRAVGDAPAGGAATEAAAGGGIEELALLAV